MGENCGTGLCVEGHMTLAGGGVMGKILRWEHAEWAQTSEVLLVSKGHRTSGG